MPKIIAPSDLSGSGVFRVCRGVILPHDLLTPAEAGLLVGRSADVIRQWKSRKLLNPRGLDERGRPLYHPDDVINAERITVENALRTNGVNPRIRRPSSLAA
ncbi:MAG TPA: MerR family transcriptional regulator [Streptosporangiaceae bacterium]|nr:MerR family transcriptional regulator [Streptosporangiaceae bacterium]